MNQAPGQPAADPPPGLKDDRPWSERSPLAQLVLCRVREFYREPEAVFWVYGFPLLIALALGTAFRNRPVENIRIDLEAAHPDSLGEHLTISALREQLATDPRLVVEVHDPETCRRRLRTARTDLVIVPVLGAPASSYEYRYDPNRPESVLARSAADSAVVRGTAAFGGAGRPAPVVTDTPVQEPGGRYIDFLIPGLLGMNLMGGGLWGVGFVTADLRIRKLLKRLRATPMRRSQFLLSILVSRLLFVLPEITLLLTFGYLAFGVGVQGSLIGLIVVILLGSASFAGIGLLVASRAQTVEAVSGLLNLVMLPMYVLSGIFFSWERFPKELHPVIRALPLTALNDALRGVMLEGNSLAAETPQLAVLAAWGLGSFFLALWWFRWK